MGVAAGVVRVAIVASGACHACRAKELCGMGESQQKIIEVRTPEAAHYAVGEQVVVSEEQRVAFRALMIGYIGAFVVLIAALVVTLALGLSEGVAATVSLVAVLLYYAGVYACRKKIEQKIYFTITKN